MSAPLDVLDGKLTKYHRDERFESVYLQQLTYEGVPDPSGFLGARYSEGCRWRSVIEQFHQRKGIRHVLDIGAGNGAIELALAAGDNFVVSVEQLWNEPARRLHAALDRPFRRVIADASHLPFGPCAFDAVVVLETIEHLEDPRGGASEIVRVLRSTGVAILTTPARLRYIFTRDPHFGIRGLLLLPRRLQRLVATKNGFDQPHHFVDRIYWTASQVGRLFGRSIRVRILARARFAKSLLWDAVVLTKL